MSTHYLVNIEIDDEDWHYINCTTQTAQDAVDMTRRHYPDMPVKAVYERVSEVNWQ